MKKRGHIAGVLSIAILPVFLFMHSGRLWSAIGSCVLFFSIALSVYAGIRASRWWFAVTVSVVGAAGGAGLWCQIKRSS